MTNLDRYREVLVCTAAIPLDEGRQAHVPLWAPVMVDGGVFLERFSRRYGQALNISLWRSAVRWSPGGEL